jgi:hypothetical protein
MRFNAIGVVFAVALLIFLSGPATASRQQAGTTPQTPAPQR